MENKEETKQPLSAYKSFKIEAKNEVVKIRAILKIALSDEPEQLIKQILVAETLYSNFNYLLAKSNYFLDIAEFNKMPAKDSGTEMERKLFIQNAVAEERQIRNIVKGFIDGLNQRIGVGQSILAYNRESLKKLQ